MRDPAHDEEYSQRLEKQVDEHEDRNPNIDDIVRSAVKAATAVLQ